MATAGDAAGSEGATTPVMNFAEEATKMAQSSEDFVLPPDIKFKSSVFDAAFHPTEDIVAVGLVSGYLKMFVFQTHSLPLLSLFFNDLFFFFF